VGRLIVFPSAARRQLFALALLARRNLSEEDLHAHRVWLLSLEELRRAVRLHVIAREGDEEFGPFKIDPALRWHPVLVGLPSPYVVVTNLLRPGIDWLYGTASATVGGIGVPVSRDDTHGCGPRWPRCAP
jgi:hypothetical protein